MKIFKKNIFSKNNLEEKKTEILKKKLLFSKKYFKAKIVKSFYQNFLKIVTKMSPKFRWLKSELIGT